MANETLIARLEQSLRQSRAARTRLSARLAELESESEIIRAELVEMGVLRERGRRGMQDLRLKRSKVRNFRRRSKTSADVRDFRRSYGTSAGSSELPRKYPELLKFPGKLSSF